MYFTGGVLYGGICVNIVKYTVGEGNNELNYYVYQTTPYDIRDI